MNPLDVIPNSLPVFGFLDDSFVVALAFDANIAPVRAFLVWERNDAKWNGPVTGASEMLRKPGISLPNHAAESSR